MKKRFCFQFEGKTYSVAVERIGNEITVEREGITYNVTLLPEEKATGLEPKDTGPKTKDGSPESSALQSSKTAAAPSTAQPTSPPAGPAAVSAHPVSAAPEETEVSGAEGEGLLAAPMTGVIKELKVVEGQSVEKGQVVLIMEAMKMDVDVQAPASGVVAEISVRHGDNVQVRQKLMMIR